MGIPKEARSTGDFLPGTLEMLILKTLSRGPNHGFGIAMHIRRVSEEALRVGEGSLYPALQRLLLDDLIEAEWGTSENNRRARYYRITAAGGSGWWRRSGSSSFCWPGSHGSWRGDENLETRSALAQTAAVRAGSRRGNPDPQGNGRSLGAGQSREFGSVALALEDSRAVWRLAWLESLGQDLRYALRSFRKSPGFAVAVVGTLGAALGLNTTAFTVMNGYALRPVAVRDPYSLYQFTWLNRNNAGHWFSFAEYESLRAWKGPFRDVFAYRNFLGAVDGHPMLGQPVTENYFTLLGAGMFRGRPPVAGDTAQWW